MKREAPVNLPASVHQRLLNLSQLRFPTAGDLDSEIKMPPWLGGTA